MTRYSETCTCQAGFTAEGDNDDLQCGAKLSPEYVARRALDDKITPLLQEAGPAVTTANPFTDPLIAVDNGGPLDGVEAWERVRYKRDIETRDEHVTAAADRLAAEVVRLRAMVAALEADDADLRALVRREWGDDPDLVLDLYRCDPWADAEADAERVLAAGGEDEGE